MLTSLNLHEKSRVVCIRDLSELGLLLPRCHSKARSPGSVNIPIGGEEYKGIYEISYI